jgi:uncharacterized membrane protein YqjE
VNDASSGHGRDTGLRGSLARLAASGLALLRTRAELAALEFEESRERAKRHLLLLAVAGLAFALAWIACCALFVVFFWDAHRHAALLAVAVLHFVVGVGALWRLKSAEAAATPPFAATLTELERDRQWLAEHFRSGR